MALLASMMAGRILWTASSDLDTLQSRLQHEEARMTTGAEIGQVLVDRFSAAIEDLVAAVGDDQALGRRVYEWLVDCTSSPAPGPQEWSILAGLFAVGRLNEDLEQRPNLNDPGVFGDGSGCTFCGKALGQVGHSFEGPWGAHLRPVRRLLPRQPRAGADHPRAHPTPALVSKPRPRALENRPTSAHLG